MPDTMLTANAPLSGSTGTRLVRPPVDPLYRMMVLAMAVELLGTLLVFGIVRRFHLY
ncbi:MAG: hypothetical protein ACRYGF_13700 [Janthinobacterium lividum]